MEKNRRANRATSTPKPSSSLSTTNKAVKAKHEEAGREGGGYKGASGSRTRL
ncbi:hypothetical protein TRAPUB_3416 [Trametes pubescens]|uniref:Uncharacterized protein n=1 Tax=Trametes pubescens TaxID=154538 RepID=A0A1M2VDW5_TRAPU|nr:hypothetical protein TRAPUB_3416 [Trametes pubescens]